MAYRQAVKQVVSGEYGCFVRAARLVVQAEGRRQANVVDRPQYGAEGRAAYPVPTPCDRQDGHVHRSAQRPVAQVQQVHAPGRGAPGTAAITGARVSFLRRG